MHPRRRTVLWTLIPALIGVLVVGAIAAGVGGFGGPGGPADAPVGSGPVVAFYGDSYTRGAGIPDLSRRWSTLVSKERGWAEFNPSRDGLGFVNNRETLSGPDLVDQVIDAEPEIVISTMGLNDNFVPPARAAEVRDAIMADFTALKKALPAARIVVVEPFWYTEERPASVERIIGWVRDGAAAIDADYVAGASHWLDGHLEWIAPDGLHPNGAGHREIAERMDAELDELGL